MSLPWKPIAELPVAPAVTRKFLFIGQVTGPKVVYWSDGHGYWRTVAANMCAGFAGNPGDVTHFFEVTPP